MATAYKADTLATGTAFMDNGGAATMEVGVTAIPVALALADTVDLVRVAGGTKLVRLEIWHGDLDTGTAALAVKIGYRKVNTANASLSPADDDDYFGSGLTTQQAAVLGSAPTRYAFVPLTFNEDVFITMTVTTAANAMSAAVTITCVAEGIARGVK